ncbi:MAG: hypothetical protein ACO29O_09930 [Chitinophagaceae bacterium]
MKIILCVLSLVFCMNQIFAQNDSLLNSLLDTENATKQQLLPSRMLFTQRLLWGEKGLMRAGNPITEQTRQRDMKIRRTMLVSHQVLGLTTMGGLIGQAIVGPRLYKNPGNHDLRDLHESIAALTNTTYSLTAVMSLFSPPPLVNRDRGLTAIRLHKWLAIVHMGGMIATNILAAQMEGSTNSNIRAYHRAAAYTTFAAYSAAFLTIKLK